MIRLIVSLLCLIVLSETTIRAKTECKVVVFENIGHCPNGATDIILSEIGLQEFKTFIKDSTYSIDYYYGDPSLENKALYICKDSLDLDLLYSIIIKSSKSFSFLSNQLFVKSAAVEQDRLLTHGSMQIRMYNDNGSLISSFYCKGLKNTTTWFNMLRTKINLIQQYKDWYFEDVLDGILAEIVDSCLVDSDEDN